MRYRLTPDTIEQCNSMPCGVCHSVDKLSPGATITEACHTRKRLMLKSNHKILEDIKQCQQQNGAI